MTPKIETKANAVASNLEIPVLTFYSHRVWSNEQMAGPLG